MLRALRESEGFVSTVDLTAEIRRYYRGNQVKNSPLRGTMTGDEGGHFVFVRAEKLPAIRAKVASVEERLLDAERKLVEAQENAQIERNRNEENQLAIGGLKASDAAANRGRLLRTLMEKYRAAKEEHKPAYILAGLSVVDSDRNGALQAFSRTSLVNLRRLMRKQAKLPDSLRLYTRSQVGAADTTPQ